MRNNLEQIKGKSFLSDPALLSIFFSSWLGKHSFLGSAGSTYYFSIVEDSVPVPDMMLHFLEQAGQHQAELKKKDDEVALLRTKDNEIARLKAEMEKMKAHHQTELQKVGQNFTEERERLTLQISKD